MHSRQDFARAITKINHLHPNGPVFARAYSLIGSPNLQLEDLADVIKLDPALTADIIHLSNSGAIGTHIPTGDLVTAIGRVGFKEIERFLGLSLAKSVMLKELSSYQMSAYEYCSCSVSTAIFMELLANRLLEDSSKAYTLGILHAIGHLVIDQVLQDLAVKTVWKRQEAIEKWELATLGFTYAAAGTLLLRSWQFPEPITEIIEYHLEPEKAKTPSKLLKMLAFTRLLLTKTGGEFANQDWTWPETDPFLQESKLSLAAIKAMIPVAQKKHQEALHSAGVR